MRWKSHRGEGILKWFKKNKYSFLNKYDTIYSYIYNFNIISIYLYILCLYISISDNIPLIVRECLQFILAYIQCFSTISSLSLCLLGRRSTHKKRTLLSGVDINPRFPTTIPLPYLTALFREEKLQNEALLQIPSQIDEDQPCEMFTE